MMGPMTRRGQAVLVMHALGLLCIGLALPSDWELLGHVVGSAFPMEPLPDNPGEAGYLLIILRRAAAWLGSLLDVLWLGPTALDNVRALLLTGSAVALLCGRPSWLRQGIERCFQ